MDRWTLWIGTCSSIGADDLDKTDNCDDITSCTGIYQVSVDLHVHCNGGSTIRLSVSVFLQMLLLGPLLFSKAWGLQRAWHDCNVQLGWTLH